jgi:hypothetical protein
MSRKKISKPEQVSKTKLNGDSGESDNMDQAKKKGGTERNSEPQKEMKSIDEWVFDD